MTNIQQKKPHKRVSFAKRGAGDCFGYYRTDLDAALSAAQHLMELEVQGLTGAGHRERTLDRINQRNG